MTVRKTPATSANRPGAWPNPLIRHGRSDMGDGTSSTTRQRRRPRGGTCEVCGEPIRYVPPVSRAKGLGRYCSQGCMGIAKRLPPSQRADSAAELLCSSCKEMKPVDDFHPEKNTRGRRYRCRACLAAENAARAPEDPVLMRRRKLRESYGITMEEYDALFAQQGGRCAICGDEKEAWQPGAGTSGRVRFLVVDHSHADGRVRGLLCGHCNRGLGHFRDDSEIMVAAAAYIQRVNLRSAAA